MSSIASTQTVHFQVTNTSSADRYVLTDAFGCDLYAISGQTLSLPFSCACECSAPRATFTVQLLAPGQSIDLTWDARTLVPYAVHEDCTMFGAPARCGSAQQGAARPVSAQPLSVSIDYLTAPPQATAATVTCTPASSGDTGYRCSELYTGGARCTAGWGGVQEVVTAFALAPQGDMDVMISIP